MKRTHALATLAATFGALAVLYACSGDDSSSSNNHGTTTDGGVHNDGGTTITPNDTGTPQPTNDSAPPPTDSGGPNCFSGTPTTYEEIINACTDAAFIDKQVDLSSMNLPDGGLKPLP